MKTITIDRNLHIYLSQFQCGLFNDESMFILSCVIDINKDVVKLEHCSINLIFKNLLFEFFKKKE
uniref:hypothetical protein n=1 Tax=Acinetobacter ursingii TaxID=108980 RepID=UPI001C0678EA